MARIDKIEFGEIVIDGKSVYSDVSIGVNGEVILRPKAHIIGASDIAPLLKDNPECIVIGTGMDGSVEIEAEVEDILENKGIKLFTDETPDAADIFNGLMADGKKVAGIFHMTA